MAHLQLSDYGLIANSTSAALVSKLGSIDWCCFPYIDSPCHFGSLLDETTGGKFQLMPQGDFRSEQRYLQRTFILETHFETPHGRATLTDWMPLENGAGNESEEKIIRRRIDVQDGKIAWMLLCSPRFSYGIHTPEAEHHPGGVLFRSVISGDDTTAFLQSDIPIEISANGTAGIAKFTLMTGEKAEFAWSWGRRRPRLSSSWKFSADQWRKRAHHCTPPKPELISPKTSGTLTSSVCLFSGPWHDTIVRSALTLRLLFHSHLGAMAESVTTSLPGLPKSSRNWDFRYTWIRNIPMTIHAFAHLGYSDEARSAFQWLTNILRRDSPASLQSVYRLDGGKDLPEKEINSWQGHHSAQPVRIGNGSVSLFQLDIYGQILLAAAEYFRLFGELPDIWAQIIDIADYICQAWRRPDHGLWELRTKPEHYVISKVYCWVALDRACALMHATHRPVPTRWEEEKTILHRTICNQGYDSDRQSFIRSFGDSDLDASALLLPLVGFLPFEDPRIQNTIVAIQSELSHGILLYRYKSPDGLPGPEGVHLASSANLVSCLALSGRVDEASDHLAELCTYATPLGFFGEQVDPTQGETTGNIPCASVHLSLIHAAISVASARGRIRPDISILGHTLPLSQAA